MIGTPGDGGITNPILATLAGGTFICMNIILIPAFLIMALFNIPETDMTLWCAIISCSLLWSSIISYAICKPQITETENLN